MTAALKRAAQIALRHMLADRDMLLESHCLLDANLKPRRDTLDDMAKPLVAKIERDIAKVRAAIRGAS